MDGQFDPLASENAQDFIGKALGLLARGVADRRHPFHTISLATNGLDGAPQLRSVVLRGFDRAASRIIFHTDKRASKFGELMRSPLASALAYDPSAKLQIRMSGTVTMHHGDDESAKKIWAGLQRSSRVCYHTPDRPGGAPSSADPLTEAEARANFCVCTLTIDQIDALYLCAAGHLRAQANFTQGGETASWVAP